MVRALIGALLIGIVFRASAQDAPDPIKSAEVTGAALYAAIAAGNFAESKNLANFGALKSAVEAQQCPGNSYAYVLLTSRSQPATVFVIASATTGNGMVAGKHFKATVTNSEADL